MRIALALALGIVVVSGCAHKRKARLDPAPPRPASKPTSGASPSSSRPPSAEAARSDPSHSEPAVSHSPVYVETGKASWYGHPYHGRVAANGEVYDMEQMTAAHRTLPFDTMVHVVNLNNSKSVDLRITDRGPFVDGRIIDVSHAAARALELIGPGTAEVRVEVASFPNNSAPGVYAVQVGAFRDRSNAERERERMAARYGSAKVVYHEERALWRVLVGSETTPDAADALRVKIHNESHERNGFVVRLDS